MIGNLYVLDSFHLDLKLFEAFSNDFLNLSRIQASYFSYLCYSIGNRFRVLSFTKILEDTVRNANDQEVYVAVGVSSIIQKKY
ncbi:hypothetical protein D3C72_1788710 [compost metagenome]